MKRILTLIAVMAFAVSSFAQQQPATVTVDLNQLPDGVRQQIEQQASIQETKAKVAQYGAWVGLGKELGGAIDGGLTAVEAHADKIADTKVGMLTMALITYKVVGEDLVQFVLGTLFACIWLPSYLFVFYKNCVRHRVLRRETVVDGKVTGREYETINADGDGSRPLIYFLAFLALTGGTCAIIFAG